MKITHTLGFTLLELLIIISIISILALWVSRLNFWAISQRELLNTEVVRLVAWIEEMRNNAIVGRAYDEDGNFPESWNIYFPDNQNYRLSYTSWWSESTIRSVRLREPFEFQSITCTNTTWTDTSTIPTWEAWIIFSIDWNVLIEWCSENWRIVVIELWAWENTRTMTVNTITWVIQEE